LAQVEALAQGPVLTGGGRRDYDLPHAVSCAPVRNAERARTLTQLVWMWCLCGPLRFVVDRVDGRCFAVASEGVWRTAAPAHEHEQQCRKHHSNEQRSGHTRVG
jgi:hypothetical protein